MLTSLYVKNFIFIEELALDFLGAMTVLTGETGAGKSAVCDALSIVLHASTDKSVIREGQPFCHIKVTFDIQHLSPVRHWLETYGYLSKDERLSCCIERVISNKGRAKGWINNKVAKAEHVKWLGSNLVTRHSQHAHQRLLSQEHQRRSLDRYGNDAELLESLKSIYKKYTGLIQQQANLNELLNRQKEQIDLLHYQSEELDALAIKPDEVHRLEQRQKELTHATEVLSEAQQAVFLISEAEPRPLTHVLQSVKQHIDKAASLDARFTQVQHTLDQIYIELMETDTLLRTQMERVMIDPEALDKINERLEVLYRIANKHRVTVEQLPVLAEDLRTEKVSYAANRMALSSCEEAIQASKKSYHAIADRLTRHRLTAATTLERLLTQKIQCLGMPGGRVVIRLDTNQQIIHPSGYEKVNFLLSASPGQPLQALHMGISGGELSRLSLALQVLIAHTQPSPTFIFDEIDIGVGGGVAERMGMLLQELSKTCQVLCVTHAAQIAVLGNHHYLVSKETRDQVTRTTIVALKEREQRISEIARMLGGIHITEKTIAYAQSMFKSKNL